MNKILVVLANGMLTVAAFGASASSDNTLAAQAKMQMPQARSMALNAYPGKITAAASGKSTTAPVPANEKLLAAAEPFENLTEMAFASTWAKIDHTMAEAEIAAAGTRQSVAQNKVGKLDTQLAAMKSARRKQDRADLALSSIEVYRVLVSSVTDSARIPTEVSLLDYAGFRYNADLKSSPIRWDDMAKTIDFAHQQWAPIAPRLKGTAVAKRFEKAVDTMDRAVRLKNHSLAASSVRSESDLVDELEKYFSTH